MSNLLITGTSSGIGLQTAITLAKAGHTVFATMRNLERSTALREAARDLPVSIHQLDVMSDSSVEKAIEQVRAKAGPIDVLINNAGIESYGTIEELPFSVFRETMETNYFGSLRCIRACVAEMRARRSGCIINVSSVAGHISASPLGAYSASKFALEALSEALAQELKAFNVRVAIVEPGIIDTPMARRISDPGTDTHYAQAARFFRMFEASLEAPTPPSVVADKIHEIIESGTWKLRHPVGPTAEPFLAWRDSMNDEEWASWGALDDAAWYDRVQQDFGLDVRPQKEKSARAS